MGWPRACSDADPRLAFDFNLSLECKSRSCRVWLDAHASTASVWTNPDTLVSTLASREAFPGFFDAEACLFLLHRGSPA